MFRSGMAESTATCIPIPDWSVPAFLAQLEFLYTGTVQDLSPDVAMETMGLADQMGLDGLKQLCEAGLMQGIDGGSVCSLLLIAHRHGAAELKQHCMEYIMGTDDDVMPMLEPLSSEPSLLMEITKELLSRHKDTT
ncbi:ARIA [Symbiodinium sp. KB8]|nr:ARIA [Symbiodinium sp. KB8]